MHVAQPNHQVRNRLIGCKVECYNRGAKHFYLRIERRSFEHQRTCVVLTLIACLIGSTSKGAPLTRILAHRLRCRYRPGSFQSALRTKAAIGQHQALRYRCRRWPRFLGNPTSWQYLMEGCRLYAIRHPGAQHWLIHHASVDVLEPIVPPAQHFLQEADLRTWKREVWIRMCPRSDQTLAWHTEPLEKPRDRVLVAVGPSANSIDRALDRLVGFAHRPPLPVTVASLVFQPRLQ